MRSRFLRFTVKHYYRAEMVTLVSLPGEDNQIQGTTGLPREGIAFS